MSRRMTIAMLAVSLSMLLFGCVFSRSGSYRFKMTVEAETAQGPRFGSSVYEAMAHRTLKLTSEESEGSGGIRGQATILDLPSGPVFVLLRTPTMGDDLDSVATLAMRPSAATGHFSDYLKAVRSLGGWFGGGKADLPRKDWPLMVRFGDLRDPTTAELVDPRTIGVMRITVETTGADLTEGIDTRLSWLGRDRLTLGDKGTMGLAMGGSHLKNGDFWRH